MRKIYSIICLIIALLLSGSAFATDYSVSGASNSNFNGTYVEAGVCFGKPYYTMSASGTNYVISYGGSYWRIGTYTSDPCNPSFSYYNFSPSSSSPTSGWQGGAITVEIASKLLFYSGIQLVENSSNNGTFTNSLTITHNNFGGSTFTGSNNEDFVISGKVLVTNIPSGLSVSIVRNNNLQLTLSVSGTAAAHGNSNDITNLNIDFQNTAFSDNNASNTVNYNTNLGLNFIDVLNVGASQTYTTIASAISAAQSFDVISLAAQTFTENNLTINDKSLTFIGQSPSQTIIQGHSNAGVASNRVFDVNFSSYSVTNIVRFEKLTIKNGNASNYGGGLFSSNANIEIEYCSFENNYATTPNPDGYYGDGGGAIRTQDGSLSVIGSTFSGNRHICVSNRPGDMMGGGAIIYLGQDNTATLLNITNCTFSGNLTGNHGGALLLRLSNTASNRIVNCTFSGNGASNDGGAVYFGGTGQCQFSSKNSIYYGNTAATSVSLYSSFASTFNFSNCLIQNNSNVGSMSATYTNCIINQNPLLGSLADNGGYTKTFTVPSNSPVVNAGISGSDVMTYDQRGYIGVGTKDIGSYEYGAADPNAILANVSLVGDTNMCKDATGTKVILKASNGLAPFTFVYSINGGSSLNAITGSGDSVVVSIPTSTAGNFVYNLISVQDAGSKTTLIGASATFHVLALPTFTATKTSYNGSDLSCFGVTDGKITITNPTGTSPFEYSKNNGSTYQTSNIFSGLAEDPYSIKVRDSFGCVSNATNIIISQPSPISASANIIAPVCAGTPLIVDGSASGGTGSLNYFWTGPNGYNSDTTNSANKTISSVATLAMDSLFTLHILDANNCAYNVSTDITIKPSPILSSNAAPVANTICEGTSTNITCTNGATTMNPAVFTTAYSNNFSSSIGSNWSFPAVIPANVPTIQSYNGGSVLGYLSNQQAKLNLTSLPSHDSVTVDFDLYIHDTWDGNSTVSGPDMFRVILDNDTALNTTFSNETWNSTTQSYPNNFSASNPSFTASITRTLPTACNFGGGSLSAKYHITKKIAHTASTLEMILEASGLENVCNESWSIDNVTVQYRSQSSNSNVTWANPSVNSNSITVSPVVNTYYVAILDGCSDSIEIIVNPTPRADFSINTVNQCVTGNSYDFTNGTTLAGGGAMTYSWTMTGASTASATTQDVTGNTYASHGSYNVRLIATSVIGNCTDNRGKVTKTVNVSPRVVITQSLPNPICAGNTVRLTANQVLGGSSAIVYTSTYTDNFETSIGSAWTFPAIVPANVPTIQSYNGQNVLGYLTNQKAIYNQTGLATHDYVKVEFDLYLHDSWDGNSTDSIGGSLIGKDIWKMSVNGSNIVNTTFSNFSYRTQAYPNNIPTVNLNGTDAVSNTLPTLCNHSGGALSSVYHISKIIPHTSGSFNLELEALGLEELCNESWSIDNFNVELGVNTATPTLLSACNGLPVSGGPVVYSVNHSNNFQSAIGSAWSFPAISPANEPSIKVFNGDSVLGFLTNQQAIYTQNGLSSHEFVKVEFDLYLHDTWDGNDPFTGVDSWKMDIDGNNVINTTFSNFSYRTQAYPANSPAVNANFTGAVNSSLPARCNLGGGAPSSKYRISKIVPHNSSSISIVLEALGLEELCNESWSIDNFELSLGAGSAPVSSATWNGGSATGATSCFVDVTPTTSTDYTVTIGACTSPITNIDVRPAPTPVFTISNASCSKTVSFTNTNIESNVTYQWNFGDGSAVYTGNTAPSHTYSAIGTYTITLSASISGGCTQTTTQIVKIADAPTAGIAFTGGTGCGNSVQFTNTSTIPSGNSASYLWSFGETPVADTSTEENPLHSYVADGNYTVTLTVSTGSNCSASTTVSVNALAAITGNQAIFTATVGSACGNMVTTTNSSTGANNQYLWSFGDGSTSNETTPTHYYTTGGFKTITLTILNGVGCATTSSKIVNISENSGTNGRVGVDFAITPSSSQVLLTNNFGFEPSFTNYPNNNPVVYCAGAPTWTYGDGTGSNNTTIYSKQYTAAGTYTVRIVQQTTNTGCFAEASKTVTVLPNPLMQLSPITFKDGQIAMLNNNSSTGVGSVNIAKTDVSMYPNPNKGSFKVKVNILNINEGEIAVVDMLGREIYKTNYNNKAGVESVEINNLNAAPGTYHLVITSNGNVAARKSFVIIAE